MAVAGAARAGKAAAGVVPPAAGDVGEAGDGEAELFLDLGAGRVLGGPVVVNMAGGRCRAGWEGGAVEHQVAALAVGDDDADRGVVAGLHGLVPCGCWRPGGYGQKLAILAEAAAQTEPDDVTVTSWLVLVAELPEEA